jgi:hypothetical protein
MMTEFFGMSTDRACEVRPRPKTKNKKKKTNKKRGHHIFPYKVYNRFIIYFQIHLKTYNHSILTIFFIDGIQTQIKLMAYNFGVTPLRQEVGVVKLEALSFTYK